MLNKLKIITFVYQKDKINNLARIFLKEERVGVLRQIDIKATVPVYEVDEDVLKELNGKKELINDFTYNG